MNLAAPQSTADYVNTGHWSHKAIAEARRYCNVHVAGDAGGHLHPGAAADASCGSATSAAYVHYTPNETISGVEFGYVPETGGVPLVADMSSSILSRPIDVSQFGLIYAGAQKNIGPSGLAVVIVRDDLIGHARAETPLVFDYKAVADNQSMLNTPPTFAWYMAGLVFKWLKRTGGIGGGRASAIASRREMLYAAIDGSQLLSQSGREGSRSWMNVTFTLNKPELDAAFLAEAAAPPACRPEGSSSVGRHAREPLQCHAAGRGRGADRVHAGIRASTRVRCEHGKP